MSASPPPPPSGGASGPPGRRPVINVRQVINQSARHVSLVDLANEGRKSIKVVNLRRINETLSRAIEQTLKKHEKQIGQALRVQIEREAQKNFLELMDLHKKVVEEKEAGEDYRRKLEEEMARMREELQRDQGNLDAERNRTLDQHSFMVSAEGFAELEKHLRKILVAFMNEERRLQIAERGPEVLMGLSDVEKALGEVLHRVLEEERRRAFEAQERLRTGEIDVLERRIAKLQQSLSASENALEQMAKLKEGDPGIASIFKSVQGLGANEGNRERKKEMLKVIFEKNLELREQIAQTA